MILRRVSTESIALEPSYKEVGCLKNLRVNTVSTIRSHLWRLVRWFVRWKPLLPEPDNPIWSPKTHSRWEQTLEDSPQDPHCSPTHTHTHIHTPILEGWSSVKFLREELRQSLYRSRFLELLEYLDDRNASWDKWRAVNGHLILGAMYLSLSRW